MNHNKVTTFYKLLEYFMFKLNIFDKTTGYAASTSDLMKLATEAYPRIIEYVSIHNECVDLIGRLSPTLNTTLHMILLKEFGKPLHLLRTAQLYRVKDMVLQRLK
jgi:hypothetical protein